MGRIVRNLAVLLALAGLGWTWGCGGGGGESPEDLVSRGSDAMGQLDFQGARDHFARAVALLEAGGSGDPALLYRARVALARCEIRTGDAEGAKASFLQLAAEQADLATWEDYRDVAGSLSDAGKDALAIDVLDAAIRSFPSHKEALVMEIEAIRRKPGLDPETRDRLKKLGYVQ